MNDSDVLAVHLAAGEGTRLRPITNDRPKPLVELGGMSLLERNVETIRAAGVAEQRVVTGYRADQIRSLGFETVHNPIYDETDMVYSLFCARDEFSDERDLLISYGDIVYEEELITALLDCEAPVCVVVDTDWQSLWEARFDEPLKDAETLEMTAGNEIVEIGGKPNSFEDIEAQYVGLIKIRSDYVERFGEMYDELSTADESATEDDRATVEMTHFLQRLVDEGWHVQAVSVEAGWLEVDTIEDLETYREWLESESMGEHRGLELSGSE